MRLRVLLFLALAALLGSSCSAFSVAAATVGGEKISESEIESEVDRLRGDPSYADLFRRQGDEFRGVARRNILGELIQQTVIEQEARRLKVRVTQAQADQLIRQEAASTGVSVRDFLDQNGLTAGDARVLASRRLMSVEVARRVTRGIDVPEAEVRKAYEENKSAFEEVHLLRLTVETEGEASEVMKTLQGGELFSSVAREKSIDDLRIDGGDMDWIPASQLGGALQGEVQRAKKDALIGPVPAADGFEIYKVLDKRPRPLESVREEITDQLAASQRTEKFSEWLAGRLRRVRVVVNPKYGRFDRTQLTIVPAGGLRE